MALPATDAFTRANGGLGANWTTVSTMGAPQINTNVVNTVAAGTDSAAFWNADAFPIDQYAQISVVTANTDNVKYVGAAVRVAAAAKTFYAAGVRGPLGAAATFEVRKTVAGTATTLSTATKTVNAGDIIRLEVVGNTLRAYINGTLQSTVTDTAITSGSAGIFVFADTGVAADAQLDNFEGGALGVPSVVNKARLDGVSRGPLVKRLHMLQRLPSYPAVAGSIDTNLQPAADAWVLTGVAPQLQESTAPAVATFVLTGIAPQLQEKITPAIATLILTGIAPRLDLKVTPSIASLVLTGSTSTLIFGTVVTPTIATLTLTGIAPQLRETITPAAAALVLTGLAPRLDTRVTPATATLTLTGLAPRLDLSIPVTAATLALVGQTSTVTVGINLTPAAAALVLSGIAPTVTATLNVLVTPIVGVLTLTGISPDVQYTTFVYVNFVPETIPVSPAFDPSLIGGTPVGAPEAQGSNVAFVPAPIPAAPTFTVSTTGGAPTFATETLAAHPTFGPDTITAVPATPEVPPAGGGFSKES